MSAEFELPKAHDCALAIIRAAAHFGVDPVETAQGAPPGRRAVRVAAHALRRVWPDLSQPQAMRFAGYRGQPEAATVAFIQAPKTEWWFDHGAATAVEAIVRELRER